MAQVSSLCVSHALNGYSPLDSNKEIFTLLGLPDEVEMKKSQMQRDFISNGVFREFFDQVRNSELMSYGVVVNSFYELEPAYADHFRKVIGRRAWHIGPVSLYSDNIIYKAHRGMKASIDEQYCLNWLNLKDSNSVVYVSFGSLARFNCAQLIEIANGLEAYGGSFIWVVRKFMKEAEEEEEKLLPEGFEERVEGKGLVIIDLAPQLLILDHPEIGWFVTHCGWNSIIEGMTAGVPMITWPLFSEQFHNEILITDVLKTGIKTGVDEWNSWVEPEKVTVTSDRLEKMVNQLMNGNENEEMRKRARDLKGKAKMAVEEGGSSYVDLIALIRELHALPNP